MNSMQLKHVSAQARQMPELHADWSLALDALDETCGRAGGRERAQLPVNPDERHDLPGSLEPPKPKVQVKVYLFFLLLFVEVLFLQLVVGGLSQKEDQRIVDGAVSAFELVDAKLQKFDRVLVVLLRNTHQTSDKLGWIVFLWLGGVYQ